MLRQQPLDRIDELVHRERLAEVIVDAKHFRIGLVPRAFIGGDHDDAHGDLPCATELFENDSERSLHGAMRSAAPRVNEHKRAGHFKEALEVIAAMRPEVDKFFEQVMVMAENEAVRKNRLALLAELLREFTTIADFSEVGGETRS